MKTHLTILLICLCLISSAQVGVGSDLQKGGKIDKDDLVLLQESSTVFFYPDFLKDQVPMIEQAFESAWNFTDVAIAPYDSMEGYFNDWGFSYLTISAHQVFVTAQTGTYEHTHIFLQLWLYKPHKKKKIKEVPIARVELHTTYETYEQTGKLIKKKQDELQDYLYREAKLFNLTPGLLKCYLATINQRLHQEEFKYLYKDISTNDLAKLRRDTLYIPEYVLTKFNALTGDESQRHDIDELMEPYPYKYKFLPTGQLDKLILSEDRPIHTLVYVKSSGTKYVTIYNSDLSYPIYHNYVPASYNLKSKDFKRIAKEIR